MTSRRARQMVGGLMLGAGRGLSQRAEREHEDEVMMREEAIRSAREMRDRQQRTMELAVDVNERALDRGERQADRRDRKAERDEERQYRQQDRADRIADSAADRIARSEEARLNRQSNEKIAGMPSRSRRGSGEDGEDAGGLSASDDRALEEVKQRFTTVSTDRNGNETKTIDYAAAAKRLEQQGRADLADYLREEPEMVDTSSTGDEAMDDYLQNYASPSQAKELRGEINSRRGMMGPPEAAPARAPKAEGVEASATTVSNTYRTKEEVGEALRAGKITQQQALQILRQKFGLR